MEGQKPGVGRIVIYTFPADVIPSKGMKSCPAVITSVWSDTCVNLHLLRDANQHSYAVNDTPTSICFDPDGAGRTWRWPDRAN